jgi:Zn-dependent peptidase ImmA (M78 family)
MNKAELGRLAHEVRRDLGLTPDQRFDPLHWGREWGVPMLSLDQATSDPATLQRLTVDAPELWSAAVVRDQLGHCVIYNHAHSAPRIRSDLAHEVAHLIAEHRLDVAWMEPGGKKCGASPAHEKEAAELGAALLVPAAAAKTHAVYGRQPDTLATKFGVSLEMATWRMGISGGPKIRERWLAKQAR